MIRAFLLGAGATNAQFNNAPLCQGFLNKLRDNRSKHFSAMADAIKSRIPDNLEKWNIEWAMKEAFQLPPARQAKFLHSLHMGISEILVPATNSDEGYMNGYLARVKQEPATHLRLLFDTDLVDKKDFFMTLNYDLYLDREILYEQGKINYGLTKNEFNKSEMTVVNEEEWSVYHLHGALNWEIDNENKLIIHAGAYNPKITAKGSNLCLVPPGYNKKHPLLAPIWKKVEKRIRRADELIIIGCSLNQDDSELHKLLKMFVDNKRNGNVKIIYKINNLQKESEYMERCRKVIGNKFKTYDHGFNASAIDGFIFK